MRTFALLGALLWLAGCGGAYWYDAPQKYRPNIIYITETPNVETEPGCGKPFKRLACVARFPDYAHVFVRSGLSQSDWECVMRHEIVGHVILAKDHDGRDQYAINCGPDAGG